MVHLPGIRRNQRRSGNPEPEFISPGELFSPQSEVVMLKDVTGWAHNDKRTGKKYHMRTGEVYYLDNTTADSFIIKGYAAGTLSREYSKDEQDEMRSAITTIGGVTHG